jgi:hypothetical protein
VLSLSDFVDAMKDELGDAETLVRDEQFIRWVNRGRARLGLYQAKAVEIDWADGAASVALPADFARFDRIVPDPGTPLPSFVVLASSVSFLDPTCVTAGGAMLYYGARYPDVAGDTPSTMSGEADEAVLSFALGRFFRRVAATRADFTRYVTVTGQSGIEVTDLLDLATAHDRDFEQAKAELLLAAPATFYSD